MLTIGGPETEAAKKEIKFKKTRVEKKGENHTLKKSKKIKKTLKKPRLKKKKTIICVMCVNTKKKSANLWPENKKRNKIQNLPSVEI